MPGKPKIMKTGEIYGMLTVVSMEPHGYVICRCACGSEPKTYLGSRVRSGNSRACGCRQQEKMRELGLNNKTHGRSETIEYSIWLGMRRRCYDKKAIEYPNYGGRGITICKRWNNFANFLTDMGQKPGGKSLDRYPNNDGNYEPGNCRWATSIEQANNKRNNVFIESNGTRMTVAQWARHLGINYSKTRVLFKLNRGMADHE